MAKQTGIFPFSGRLGNVVGNNKGGFRIHVDPSNPKTLKQGVTRGIQSYISKLFAGLSPIARILLGASWMSELIQINRDEVVAKDVNADLADPDNYQIPVGTVQLTGGNPDLLPLSVDTDLIEIYGDSNSGNYLLFGHNINDLTNRYGMSARTTDHVVFVLHNQTSGRCHLLGIFPRSLVSSPSPSISISPYLTPQDEFEILSYCFDDSGRYSSTEYFKPPYTP